jgi:integrase
MKRGLKGHGTVTVLASGKWRAKVPVGKTSAGKTRYVTRTSSTKREANRQRDELIFQRGSQRLVAGPRKTLREFATDALLESNDRTMDRTRDGYFRALRRHVFPVLGSRPLLEVSSLDCQKLFDQLRRRGLSASTVNNVRTALSKVFTEAVRHELVATNPVARTVKARRREGERTQVRTPWNQDEVRRALAAAESTPMELFFKLVLATGMRRGEVLGLQWDDVDFERQTISIQRTIHHDSITQLDGSTRHELVVAAPKTASSRRVNQLTEPILDTLRRHQAEQDLERSDAGDLWCEQGYVFTNNVGGPLDESKLSRRYRAFLKAHSLRYIRIHDMRHTFATVLIDEDAGQLASVSKALGHSSISITMDTYAKTARVETQATSRMSEIMFPERGKVTPIRVDAPGKVASIPPGLRRPT